MTVVSSAAPAIERGAFERRLVDMLMRTGKLNEATCDRVSRTSATTGERLETVLVRVGGLSETDVAQATAEILSLPLVRRSDFPEEPVLEEILSENFLRSSYVLPVGIAEGRLRLAMADPTDSFAIEALRLAAGMDIDPLVARPNDLDAAFERLYGARRSVIGDLSAQAATEEDDLADADRLKDIASEAPVVRIVNLIIERAIDARASDIHMEPFQDQFIVRYRIDGVLRDVEAPPFRLRAAITSRIKLMARMNIAERRLPQDGRIRISVGGQDVDLRVSTVPTIHGESLVIRVLDRDRLVLDFEGLGFHGPSLERYLQILGQPHGIVLVTGPTGSGKTTTLYASLHHLSSSERKIITVEDPVEYQLERINQIQVRPQVGLTFAHALRSILRQNPDIIMVGEIRDVETAEIGVQAALTGHLVLSTLHTNDATSAITRLLDMGIPDYLLTSTMRAVIAQRLVRRLCPRCREPYDPPTEVIERLQLGPSGQILYRPRGCELCAQTGFLGRIAISEVLPMTEEVYQVILKRPTAAELRRVAAAVGMRDMKSDGIDKARNGVTTIEEVLRVTGETGA